jgi:ABC-2 type transport system permease protein
LIDTTNHSKLKLRLERIGMLAATEYYQRYYGSKLGVIWAFLNPLFRILIYYLAFTYLIFRNRDPQFILYLFLGITVWQYFSENTNKGVTLLKGKKYLIQNVGMAKSDIFFASALSTSVSFALNVFLYCIVSLWFDVEYSFTSLLVIALFFNLFLIVVGVSMILSTIHLYFTDFKHVWDISLLLGFWTVPIIWDSAYVYTTYPFMLYGNPITGILVNLRNVLLYNSTIDLSVFALDFAYGFLFLIIGFGLIKRFSFKVVERV